MKKKFDCVEMKNEIQRRLLAERNGCGELKVSEEPAPYKTSRRRTLRVFVDTSVFGGCFDEEFEKESRRFFDEVKDGRFAVVVSQRVLDELEGAPEVVSKLVSEVSAFTQEVDVTDEIVQLRDAYLEAGILGASSLHDAEHIAVASVEQVDLLVSWNFKHIVHFDKIKAYNAINMLKGYRQIDIRSPQEVVGYEKDI
jgi:predicted nucleic acid-binding protein